jgi:predicted TIM-barrel fold metal-dependent hydrolase
LLTNRSSTTLLWFCSLGSPANTRFAGLFPFSNCKSQAQGKIAPGGKLVKLLRTYPNVSCDLSAGSGSNALQRDPEFARDFLIEFQDRILYGRDCFDNSHQTVLKSLGLPEAVLTKIFSGNALRLVSI